MNRNGRDWRNCHAEKFPDGVNLCMLPLSFASMFCPWGEKFGDVEEMLRPEEDSLGKPKCYHYTAPSGELRHE